MFIGEKRIAGRTCVGHFVLFYRLDRSYSFALRCIGNIFIATLRRSLILQNCNMNEDKRAYQKIEKAIMDAVT
ncbi:unnamed protein product [Arctia plantaginis]|uniref:Uncharacterized protein n=1 Tax=Arctia plantaginis TaxID=874455 RepID=A0A8S0YZD7_ARCPL|nr:unnamed protein product [Arctia plantaginis]